MKNTRKPDHRTEFWLDDLRQLRAVVSPIRQEIVDGVVAIGPCTVTTLAAALGRRPTALYSHVAYLRRAGILRVVNGTNEAKRRGRAPALLDVPGRPVRLRHDLSSTRHRAVLRRYVAAMLRNAERGFARGLQAPNVVADGPERNLWAARWKGWLGPRERRRAVALLNELILLFDNAQVAHPNARLQEITFVLTPVP